ARHYQAAGGRLDEGGRRSAVGAQLRAAQAARAAAAYAEALGYAGAGLALAAADDVSVRALRLEQAEALASTGAFAAADQAFAALTEEAPTAAERARVTARRQRVLAALGRHREVLSLTRREASGLGLELPGDDDPAAIEAAIVRDRAFLDAWRRAGGELPDEGEPDAATRALVRLLGLASSSAFTLAPRLHRALVLATVRCAIERGVDASCAVAFGQLGHLLGEDDGDHREGHRFARLGVALAERAGDLVWTSKASVMLGGYCTYWAEPVASCAAPLERGLRGAIDTGDALWAGFAGSFLTWAREVAGEPLDDVRREAEEQLALSRRARLDILTWDTLLVVRLVAALQGRTPSLSSLDGDGFDEAASVRQMAALERRTPHSTYLVFKAQALVYAGEFASALAVARQAAELAWSFAGWTHSAKRCFYHLVALAWSAPAPRPAADLDELAGLARQLAAWASSCPANFEHMALLAAAEQARLTGDPCASGRYEEAADAARRQGLVHDEGLICEAAARHLLALGHHRAAAALLRDADACFVAWGATGKLRQLRQQHAGHLADAAPASSLAPSSSHSSGSPLGAVLDLASLARATEAISSERSLDRLLHRLLQILVENAGGQLGTLVLRHGRELHVVAALAADGAALTFEPEPLGQSARLPRSLAQLALRTHQDLFIHDALDHRAAATDPYVRRHHVRAVLCLHLRQQGQETGLVVIEHRLSPGAFPRDRQDALRLLATQAAVAVENARLYARLDEHRRLLEQQVSERTAELRDRNEHLAATLRQLVEGQNRLADDLAEATDYVRARLPAPLRHPRLTIDWRFLPCAELGGDGLGYQWIDDDHLALYVVDVCGHGVASALLSVQILDVLRSDRLPGVDVTDPSAVVRALNRAFPHEAHRHLHFTLWYGVYRPSTRALRYL
ncbi:MAG: GAF domain-containing protein, partial [Myxococcales bacterium]